MKTLDQFQSKNIQIVFTDIDGTLTDDGRLSGETYQKMWALQKSGIDLVPVTGRPAGWCEMIARQWPVFAVVGENGGFYFRYDTGLKKMRRFFLDDTTKRQSNREKLERIKTKILKDVPGCAVASDQFCRILDLAIDFSEDVPALSHEKVKLIERIFLEGGAQAKISHIHVNGWFGSHNKILACKELLAREFKMKEEAAKQVSCFVGDSPNDEPSFEFFPISFGVANVKDFEREMKFLPTFIAPSRGGTGFNEIATRIMALKGS